MELHNLKSNPNSRFKKTRKARGIAAGKGKTAGRGMNGQNSRSGGGVRLGFEGGQNPWFRRLPKRGFNNINHVNSLAINLDRINKLFKENDKINLESLISKNLARKNQNIKILANGSIDKKIIVELNTNSSNQLKISKAAHDKIIKVGGQVKEG